MEQTQEEIPKPLAHWWHTDLNFQETMVQIPIGEKNFHHLFLSCDLMMAIYLYITAHRGPTCEKDCNL